MTVKDEALRLAAEGMSVRDISRTLGVPRATVGDWVQVSPGRTRGEIMDVSREREEKAVALFKDGQSARQIGTELSISHMQVTRLLRRAGVMLCLIVVASFGAPVAHARGYDSAKRAVVADGNPFRCKAHHPSWGRLENECVVRVVYRKHPRLLREALLVVPCESGWNNLDGPAWGIFQFIGSTARSWSAFLWTRYASYRVQMRRYSYDVRRMFQHPVWSSRASLGLRLSAGRWSGPWYPSQYCHHLR